MIWRFLVLLLAAPAWAQLSPGPTSVGGGPAYNVNAAAVGAPVVVPAAGASDVNCPATVPTTNTQTTQQDNLNASITCATPSRTTSVLSVSFFAASGTTGSKMKCSVYTFPAGYVAATTSVPKVAAGCDTTEWVAPGATTNAWITLTTTGSCPLAASTRYMIACNQGISPYAIGYNNTSCTVGGVQCNQQRNSQVYTTTPLPDPWTANNQGTASFGFYMTVQ